MSEDLRAALAASERRTARAEEEARVARRERDEAVESAARLREALRTFAEDADEDEPTRRDDGDERIEHHESEEDVSEDVSVSDGERSSEGDASSVPSAAISSAASIRGTPPPFPPMVPGPQSRSFKRVRRHRRLNHRFQVSARSPMERKFMKSRNSGSREIRQMKNESKRVETSRS